MPFFSMGPTRSLLPKSDNLDACVTASPIYTKLFIPEDFLPDFTAKVSFAADPIPALILGNFLSSNLFNIFI